MIAKCFVVIVLFCAKTIRGQPEILDDEEVALFKELETQLKYKAGVNNIVTETKRKVEELIKDGQKDVATKTLGVVQVIGLNIKKLKGNDTYAVAEASFAIISNIVGNIPPPYGTAFSVVASLLSVAFGFAAKPSATANIGKKIEDVVLESDINDIKGTLKGFKDRLDSNTRLIKTYNKLSTLTFERQGRSLRNDIPPHLGAEELGKLASDINERKKVKYASRGKEIFKLIVLYCQIASYRDMMLQQAILQLLRIPGEDGNNTLVYEYELVAHPGIYREALRFLHRPQVSESPTVVHYYPVGHSNNNRYVHEFMKSARAVEAMVWEDEWSFILQSVKWPAWYLEAEPEKHIVGIAKYRDEYHMEFENDEVYSNYKVIFKKRSDGYYELQTDSNSDGMMYMYYGDKSLTGGAQGLVMLKKERPIRDTKGHFVVIRQAKKNQSTKDIVAISPRNHRGKFFNTDKYAVKPSAEKEFDTKAQFYLFPCNVPKNKKCPTF